MKSLKMHIVCSFLLAALLSFTYGRLQRPIELQSKNDYSVYNENAIAAIKTLQEWYNVETGLWESTGWWNAANVLTMLADFTSLDPSLNNITYYVFQNTFHRAQIANVYTTKTMGPHVVSSSTTISPPSKPQKAGFQGYINNYYDDEGWWALAWLKIYDVTHHDPYLHTAISIFADMTMGYDATCGGLWWDKAHTQNGAIENELFLAVAAELASRVPASDRQYYVDWALRQWEWFHSTGLINDQHAINNGLDLKTCQNDGGTVWTYNQGVILGGLISLHKVAPDPSYLLIAEEIALAAIEHLTDANGILHEPCEPDCGADGPTFKGIFMRNLQQLQHVRSNKRFEEFILKNAESIWSRARGNGDQLGLVWDGPFKDATAATQTAALEALVAAISVDVATVGSLIDTQ